jgi:hypothetical protein
MRNTFYRAEKHPPHPRPTGHPGGICLSASSHFQSKTEKEEPNSITVYAA